jgi:hypothetical protein
VRSGITDGGAGTAAVTAGVTVAVVLNVSVGGLGIGYTFTVRRADLPLIIGKGWTAGTTKDALDEAKTGVPRYLAR